MLVELEVGVGLVDDMVVKAEVEKGVDMASDRVSSGKNQVSYSRFTCTRSCRDLHGRLISSRAFH